MIEETDISRSWARREPYCHIRYTIRDSTGDSGKYNVSLGSGYSVDRDELIAMRNFLTDVLEATE